MFMVALILLVACVILYREMSRAEDEASSANQALMLTKDELRSKEDALQEAKKEQEGAVEEAQNAQDELEDYKSKLKRNMKKLHDSILDKFLHSNEAHGTIIDQEFEAWWKLWDGYEEYENNDNGDDNNDDDITLETVEELMRRLRRLPNSCDDYIIRFKEKDGDNWIQPDKCWIDDSGDIVLGLYNDGESHSALTVADLYNILNDLDTLADNYSGEAGRPSVDDDTKVYILYCEYEAGSENQGDNDDKSYYQALDERFIILNGKQRVEIPMSLY